MVANVPTTSTLDPSTSVVYAVYTFDKFLFDFKSKLSSRILIAMVTVVASSAIVMGTFPPRHIASTKNLSQNFVWKLFISIFLLLLSKHLSCSE